MFELAQLQKAIDLHQRSYGVLKWVRDALRMNTLSFATIHSSTDTATAAAAWLQKHHANLPADLRPGQDDLDAFARVFVSFLTTSFSLSAEHTRVVSGCGCYCSWCRYLRSSPDLVPRSPTKKDVQTAKELKRLYLSDLALEADDEHPTAAVARVVELCALHEQVALCTWTAELMRRMQFASQGQAVLALWREFAWKDGAPKRRFQLQPAAVLAAEKEVIAALRQ